jgi:hypothetical protein
MAHKRPPFADGVIPSRRTLHGGEPYRARRDAAPCFLASEPAKSLSHHSRKAKRRGNQATEEKVEVRPRMDANFIESCVNPIELRIDAVELRIKFCLKFFEPTVNPCVEFHGLFIQLPKPIVYLCVKFLEPIVDLYIKFLEPIAYLCVKFLESIVYLCVKFLESIVYLYIKFLEPIVDLYIKFLEPIVDLVEPSIHFSAEIPKIDLLIVEPCRDALGYHFKPSHSSIELYDVDGREDGSMRQ